MTVLLDTNIAVRLINRQDPRHLDVVKALSQLAGERLVFAPQVLYELYAVITRPMESNGYGLAPSDGAKEIRQLQQMFDLLSDPIDLPSRWLKLCETRSAVGKPSHDARLIAFMLAHQIDAILTLSPQDFKRFPEVQILTP